MISAEEAGCAQGGAVVERSRVPLPTPGRTPRPGSPSCVPSPVPPPAAPPPGVPPDAPRTPGATTNPASWGEP